MKILNVVGTRPEIIKTQPVMKEIQNRGHELVFVHTGQHYDFNMSGVFIEELELNAPNYFLNVKSTSQGAQTGQIISKCESILKNEQPDLVIVTGDTNSGLGAAITSSKLGIKLAHVEAGCRSFDRTMTEEINRKLISHIADLHFAPTKNCQANLISEGISAGVFLSGHPIVDLIHKLRSRLLRNNLREPLGPVEYSYVLITLHRRENITNPYIIRNILMAMDRLSHRIPVIFPCHPHTKKQITSFALTTLLKNLKVIEPVSYLQSLSLIKFAKFVMTDSGGVQQEAALIGTPCITLREKTEWIETLEAGVNSLAGHELNRITQVVNTLDKHYDDVLVRFKSIRQLFGTVGASNRIADIIERSESFHQVAASPDEKANYKDSVRI